MSGVRARLIAALTAATLGVQTLAPAIAWAHDFEFPGGSSPDAPPSDPDGGGPNGGQPPVLNPTSEDDSVQTGIDPVDIARGEFTLTRQDLLWPGRGLAADITFTYRSRSAYNGPFGYGWDMSYNRRIRKLANNNLMVLRGANRKDEWTFSAPNTYTSPAGIYDSLLQNADGTYTLTSPHGEKEFYDVNGRLTRIEDRNGNALTFTYDPAGLLPVSGTSAYFVSQTTGVIARDYRLTRITDTVGRAVDFTYTAEGRLASLIYAGRTITYGYDPAGSGDLVSVTTPASPEFPSGNTTRYAYATHNLTAITDPKGQTYLTNVYDAATDRVTQQTYGTGASQVAYTAPPVCPSTPGTGNPGYSLSLSPLTANPGATLTVSWTAPAGSATNDWIGLYQRGAPHTSYKTFFYTSGATSGTRTLTTSTFYPQDLYEARYLLNNGYTSSASSNTACLGSALLVPGPVTSSELTDRNGVRTRYDFDAAGHITRMEQFTDGMPAGEPASYVTTYGYDAAGERTRIVYPRGNAVEFTYDAKGNLLEIRRKAIGAPAGLADPADLVTAFTYEPNFNFIKTVKDPRGNTTTYTYDYELGEPTKGNLRRITQPLVGGVTPQTTFTYTGFGQLDTITDPTGSVTRHAYDAATGDLLQVTEGFGTAVAGTTTFTYDAVGNVTSARDPRGHTTTFTYNALNQLIKVTAPSPFNFATHYTYDANGNLIQVDRQATPSAPGARPPTGTTSPTDDWQSAVYTYTALDQLASVQDDLGHVTQFGYDATGNRTRVTDAKGQITTFTYDERHLLWQVTDAATPAGVTEYLYDLNGNLASLKDAKANTTMYAYDDFDRLIRLTYPGGAQETYAYDAGSNLTSRLNARTQTLTYAYDALNRLTQKTSPTETATFTYDAASRLRTAANLTGTLSHTYDARGRLNSVTFPGSQVVGYGYDAASNRTSLTYPGGPTVSSTYDALNRLTTLTDLNAQPLTFASDALSRRTSLTRPNGVVSSSSYDAASRLTSLSHAQGATTLGSFTYGYDPLGNRLSEARQPANTTSLYTYDPLSQLTAATNPAVSFAYDALGNRTSAQGQPYTTNPLNQYTQVGPSPLTYDLDGNLTSDGTATYTWDAENRLTQVVRGSTTVTFTYDALGRRASKTVNGTTTKFLYDGADLLAEVNSAGTITARTLFGPGIDAPLERKAGTTTSYYSADGLGSIAHLTDSTGTLVEFYTYDSFGLPTIRNASGTVIPTSALGNPFLFTGREWDSETGLYFYRSRYYHPTLGRFLSRDPLGYAPDVNLYRYVRNTPLTFIDPFGYLSLPVGGGGWTCLDCGGGRPLPGPTPPGDRPAGILSPFPPGDRPLPPSQVPPGDRPSLGPDLAPGDRGPTKSLGPLQGTAQPGVEKADSDGEDEEDGENENDDEEGFDPELYGFCLELCSSYDDPEFAICMQTCLGR